MSVNEEPTDAALVAMIQEVENRRAAAVVNKDTATLETMLSDGLMYCHSTGIIDSKAEFLAKIVEGRSIFHAFAAEVEHATMPRAGIVIAVGRLLVDVEIAGKVHEVRGRFMSVWHLHAHGWVMEALQGVGG